MALVFRPAGSGELLSAALVSALMCAWYAAALWRALRAE